MSGKHSGPLSQCLCRSVYTVSDKHLRHGGSGYETTVLLLLETAEDEYTQAM